MRLRDEFLLEAIVDDDFQDRPAGFDAEAVWIERIAIGQASSYLAFVNRRNTSLTTSGRDRDSSSRTTTI